MKKFILFVKFHIADRRIKIYIADGELFITYFTSFIILN